MWRERGESVERERELESVCGEREHESVCGEREGRVCMERERA